MGILSLAGTAAGAYFGGPQGAAIGGALGSSLEGGGKTKVPGSMAKPENPAKNILGDDGFVKDQFQLGGFKSAEQETATGMLGELRNMARSEGPTKFLQSTLDANNQQTGILKDQLSDELASSRATAETNLAMKGGLGTGGRERLAASTAQAQMMGNQQINQQGSLNNLNATAADQQQKFGLMKDLPSQFLNIGQMETGKQEFDIRNSIGTATSNYDKQMQAYAANQMARQQAQAANKASGGLF